MKRIVLFLALMILALPMMAADVTLEWDPMPAGQSWTAVRCYEINSAGAYVRVGEVPGTSTKMTLTGVTPGIHKYVVRPFNVWEAPDSNAVTTPALLDAIKNLRFSFTVSVQGTVTQ